MRKTHERIDLIEKYGGAFQGRKELLAHLNGDKLSARQMCKAKCYDCMGYFDDGRQDCQITTCPIYPIMAYRKGGVQKSRTLTDEQKNASKIRLKDALIRRHANKELKTSNQKTKPA